MKYEIEFKLKAIKDLKFVKDKSYLDLIINKINLLANNLQGDVKKLTNFSPEYRLRVGNYRVLFELEENNIIIYRIIHRREVYR